MRRRITIPFLILSLTLLSTIAMRAASAPQKGATPMTKAEKIARGQYLVSFGLCNDCHTPHAFIPKYLSKAENGIWHSKGFTLQDFHEPIQIRAHNAETLHHNCIDCHKDFVHDIVGHEQAGGQWKCTHCHPHVGHGPAR